jgi:WD40 repeat protein
MVFERIPSEESLNNMMGDRSGSRQVGVSRVLYDCTDFPPELIKIVNDYSYEFAGQKNGVIQQELTRRSLASLKDSQGNQLLAVSAIPSSGYLDGSHGHIDIFDIKNKRKLISFSHDTIRGLCWGYRYPLTAAPKGTLLSGAYDGTIKLWNVGTGKCLKTIDLLAIDREAWGHVCKLIVLSGYQCAAVLETDVRSKVVILDTDRGVVVKKLEIPVNSRVYHVSMLSDNCLACVLYSPEKGTYIRRFDTTLFNKIQDLPLLADPLGSEALIVAITGDRIVLCRDVKVENDGNMPSAWRQMLDVVDLASARVLSSSMVRMLNYGNPALRTSVALPDDTIVLGYSDGTLYMWDTEKCRLVKELEEKGSWWGFGKEKPAIDALTVLPNGDLVSCADSEITFWE